MNYFVDIQMMLQMRIENVIDPSRPYPKLTLSTSISIYQNGTRTISGTIIEAVNLFQNQYLAEVLTNM
jgi:hypothetical protein